MNSTSALDAVMNNPTGCVFGLQKRFMYCTTLHSVIRIDMIDPQYSITPVVLATNVSGYADRMDGFDPAVRFDTPQQPVLMIHPLSHRTMLFIADQMNGRIRSVVIPPEIPPPATAVTALRI